MSLGVYELQRTIDEVHSNLVNKDGLLPEGEVELLQTNAELLNELDNALGQRVLFAVQLEMIGEPELTEGVVDEPVPAAELLGEQDALFPVSMIKQEGNY